MRLAALTVALLVLSGAATAIERRLSDGEIRQLMVRESVSNFLGVSCPCPYSVARDGSLCRNNSAYENGRGGPLLCFEHDISDAMVAQYRAQHNLPKP